MNCYEHTFIAKPDLRENQSKIIEKYKDIIIKKTLVKF